MASRKEYEMLFQLNAQLGGSYNSTFKSAQGAVASMQKEIEALSKSQSDITAYQKQQSAVEATRKKLEVLQQQYDNIQREMNETGQYSSTLENKLLSKQQQIDKTSASLDQQTQKLGQMGAALREAGVNTDNLEKESAELATQLDKVRQEQEQAAEGAGGFGSASVQAFGAIQQAIVAAGIAKALKEIYDAYMACVNIAGDFEEAMSTVEALSGATADEMAALTAQAKELGATTKFTAKESADAMGYMAMAGWDAADMISGMDGVLQLAAASGEDLAMVSDIVTDSLSAFGLTAADTAHFSDVLAAAATNSNTNVSIMGETFKMSASVAGALGYSIEDVAVAVGLMANSGVKGSIAGTALKNTFNGLLEGVTLTSDAFGEYEYSAIKADGSMKEFGDTIDELRVYFDQMTEAERVNNAMTIAGQRGYNGLLAILNATDEDYNSLTASINGCTGAASKMAAIKLDNMKGELVLMNSAADALKTTLGEQFTPVMRELYAVGTQVFQALDNFVKEHPALVKAIAAFLAVMGAVVAALTAYAVAAKIATAVSALLTAAIPGVNVVMGVAAAVGAITAGIVALVSASNEAVPSVKELTTAARDMQDAMDEATATYDDTVTATMAAAGVADTYIGKLEALEAAGITTDEQARQYHNTLALLCQVVPELASSIDLETDTIEGGTEALRANTEAWKQNAMQQAYQDQLTALYESYSSVLIEAEQNSIKLTKAQYDLEAANQAQSDALARIDTLWAEAQKAAEAYNEENGTWADGTMFLTQEYYDLQNSLYELNDQIWIAEDTVNAYTKAIDKDSEAVAEAEEQMALAEEAVKNLMEATGEGGEASEEAAQQTKELQAAIEGTAEEMAALTEAYTTAYNAAYDSISGQYALWDEAEKVVATSAGKINTALESQITYWQSYNSNLEALGERSADIEGLSDMIATFADGSADSVNAIAGMASASDEDLAAMVSNWKTLQEEQENASGSIAELKTDFTAAMDELQEELAADIEAMDLGSEAAESGKATIQGFINGADGMLPDVEAAYANVAKKAMAAIDAQLGIHSPSRVMMEKARMTWAGYINETERMEPQVASAMAGAADTGAEAFSAEEAQLVMLMPQLLAQLNAASGWSALRAEPNNAAAGWQAARGSAPAVEVHFHIEGNASPETVDQLRAFGDDFAEAVVRILEERETDLARRTYR